MNFEYSRPLPVYYRRKGKGNNMNHSPGLFEVLGVGFIVLLVCIAVFDWVLKAIGMWKAARRTQTAWFVCLLIFNTAGILPIIYFLTGGKKPETLKKTEG